MSHSSPWKIFTLVAVAQFMVVLDVCITNVALPAIQQSLNISDTALQWVVTSYALTFGGFLLLGGRLSDIYGHRRILLVGLGMFTVFSFFIGLSFSPSVLIVLRALQGASAAFMSPAALSIVLITFREGKERNRALGHWTTVATGGAAVGLLLGGLITYLLNWRWNFFINVPLGIVLCIAITKFLPHEKQEKAKHHLDAPGALLITSALVLLVYAVSEAPMWGWTSASTIMSGSIILVLFLAFLFNESHCKHPLVPLSIFKVRNVVGSNLMMAPISAGSFGMFFLISLYIQQVLHYSPLIAGISFLPFPLILGSLSQRMARGVSRFGYKPFLIAGPLCVATGVSWLIRLPVDGNYFTDILPNIIIMPIGMAMTFMPLTVAATSGVEPEKAGLVSGIFSTSQQMGGAIGLAILSSVAASITAQSGLPETSEAIVRGYHYAFAVASFLILGGMALGLLIIREKKITSASTENTALHAL